MCIELENLKERDLFLKQLMENYISILKKNQDIAVTIPYMFASKYFITEAIAVFNANLLKERLEYYSITPLFKKDQRLWSKIFVNGLPDDPHFLNNLKLSHKGKEVENRKNIFDKIIRRLSLLSFNKGNFRLGNLKLKPINKNTLKKNTISTQRSQLIQEHAKLTDNDVVFCRSDRWFS